MLRALFFVIATDGASEGSMCIFVHLRFHQLCVRGVCAVTKSTYSSSTAAAQRTPAVFYALAFVPVVTVYVSGSQQKIESRRQFHVQCNNHTHIAGLHTRYTKHAAVAKPVALQKIETPTFPLLNLRRPRGIKSTPSPSGTYMST